MKEKDLNLMQGCLELARDAEKRGDTAVGSLIAAENGQVIAEASERNRTEDLFAHAEILAIKEAVGMRGGNKLSDCTLYTSTEPVELYFFPIGPLPLHR